MKPRATIGSRSARPATRPSKARLMAMIEEALLDAYGDSEQTAAWVTALEEHLELPFDTKVLDNAVTVIGLDLRDGDQIVAICTRGRARQAISLLDLPLPTPTGSEWIEAYRLWRRGR